MLKKFAVFGFSILFFIACDKTVRQTTNVNVSAQITANDSLVVSGHSQASDSSGAPQANAPVQKSQTKTKWTQSGSPVDTSVFDAEIERAEKDLKVKPKSDAAKKALAEAFFKRGVALTEVGQYASALGDYRRVLHFDADNKEAKTWIDEIIKIYDRINREAPNEGEEPPPLPFAKKG